MRRIIAIFIVLGLLLPLTSSASTVLLVSQSPFSRASFNNESGGTVSAIPIHVCSNVGYIRSESRHPALHPPAGHSAAGHGNTGHGTIQPPAGSDYKAISHVFGLPADCGLTIIRLARPDY